MGRYHYFVDNNNKRQWKEYDKNNNLINCSIPGYQEWNESDSNGNIIHHKNSNGYESWHDYDENNRMIYYKDHSGYEESYMYLDDGVYIAKCKYVNGKEEYKRFNSKDELLYIQDSEDNSYNCIDTFKHAKKLIEYLSNIDIYKEKESKTIKSLLDNTITALTNIRFTTCEKDEIILLLQDVINKLNSGDYL